MQTAHTKNVSQGNICSQHNGKFVPGLNSIQNNLNELSSTTNYSNISIRDSSNVHLGHKINYNGDLNLNLVNEDHNGCRISVIQNESDCSEVVINKAHTATSSSNNQTKDIQLIRDIQSFHVDTHGWNDIAYNFLIGSDGYIYEGRGWGIEGAHTFGYNNRSIGISFIGCFINRKPTDEALSACKNLLERGVDEGHLSKNYKLLGHRQCTPTESPGTKLFEEIMKWDHFYNKSIEDDMLSDNES